MLVIFLVLFAIAAWSSMYFFFFKRQIVTWIRSHLGRDKKITPTPEEFEKAFPFPRHTNASPPPESPERALPGQDFH